MRIRKLAACAHTISCNSCIFKDVVNLSRAANELNVSPSTIRTLISNGLIKATQIIKFAPWQIERFELDTEIVKEAVKKLKRRLFNKIS